MILQLLNQYVYKLEYIILGTIKDTSIKISIDDTFYDIRQKINNPDLVKIHKEDLKEYNFDMKYGRNNVLKNIIHSMYKNSYNCDIFLGIGGNDKKVHKYRTNNDRQVIVVDKVIALRFGQRDEKQFRSASQLDIVEIVPSEVFFMFSNKGECINIQPSEKISSSNFVSNVSTFKTEIRYI